ncbi:MAG: ATP-binding protein, partial [Halofilum sp. (in: g-proteobacteria)]|nr:ATP-binding protein [Halofilum sp. (in: g-proteobacteria)]
VWLRRRRPGHQTQCYVHFYTDIVLLGVAIYASGGVASGLGILLVIPVAAAGTLLQTRYSLVYAALATLVLLTSEVVRHLQGGLADAAYTQAALLGLATFAAAGLARLLARRHAQSAALARQRSVDLKRMAALNELIIQQMEAGILVVDREGRVMLANASAPVLLGQTEPVAGLELDTLSARLDGAMREHRETGQNPVQPVTIGGEDERARRLQVQFTDLGEQGTLIMLEDAAFIENQLQQLKLASLGRLTASIAHEIRNPLAAINHSSQLLAEAEREPADARLLEIQLENCRRINAIIESILQLTRRRPGDQERMELEQWLEAFVDEYRTRHELSEERLTLHTDFNGAVVACHPEQLRQVLTNLCDNCLQHGRTENGGPVRIELRLGPGRGGLPIIDVIDDGVPIPQYLVDELFEPFYTTSHSGTGLGLYLARELCEVNGAELHYVNTEAGNCLRIAFHEPKPTRSVHG